MEEFLEVELRDTQDTLSEYLQADHMNPVTHLGLTSVTTEVRTSLGYT